MILFPPAWLVFSLGHDLPLGELLPHWGAELFAAYARLLQDLTAG